MQQVKIRLIPLLLIGIILSSTRFVIAASSDLSVKLGQPKSPTNQNSFPLSFVALDVLDRPITVKCFKKAPGDSVYSQFDSDKILNSGGNSGSCAVDSAVLTAAGSYSFYASATAGTDEVNSQIVSVDFNTSGPGTPHSFSKEKITDCVYRVKFKTADDGDKTIKVELFRSETTTISIDGTGRVATLFIGSNQDGQIDTGIPDCGKNYYFVLRAVDSSDNVSSLVGDGYTKIITQSTQSTTSETPSGALVVSNNSQVPLPSNQEDISTGTQSEDKTTEEIITITPSSTVLGATDSPQNTYVKLAFFLSVLLAGYFLYRSYTKARR